MKLRWWLNMPFRKLWLVNSGSQRPKVDRSVGAASRRDSFMDRRQPSVGSQIGSASPMHRAYALLA
jgi:hypothetical protein